MEANQETTENFDGEHGVSSAQNGTPTDDDMGPGMNENIFDGSSFSDLGGNSETEGKKV